MNKPKKDYFLFLVEVFLFCFFLFLLKQKILKFTAINYKIYKNF